METSSRRLVSRFELLGTQPAEMTVAARSIVEGIDVIRQVSDRQLAVLVDLFLDPFFLQAAEKRLGNGVVPAVAFPAHTRLEVIRAAESSPRRVVVAGAHCHQHRVEQEGPTAADVQAVKEAEKNGIEEGLRDNGYWQGSLRTLHLLGRDPGGILKRIERVDSLNQQNIHEAIKKYFPVERHTIVTLMPEARK